jgi:hypothetical protein
MNPKLYATLFLLLPALGLAKPPKCMGINQWPTVMAFVHLKDAGLTDNDSLDFPRTRTTRLSSEKIGKTSHKQIHHVVFREKSGKTLEAITISTSVSGDCSEGPVEVYVVSRRLGGS